jgi:hypothetical protein
MAPPEALAFSSLPARWYRSSSEFVVAIKEFYAF